MRSRPTWRDGSANSHIIFIFKMNMRGAGQSRRMRWVWGLRSPVGLIFCKWSVIERVVQMFETDLIDLVVDVVIPLYLGGGGASFVLNKSLYSFLADWCAGSELWPVDFDVTFYSFRRRECDDHERDLLERKSFFCFFLLAFSFSFVFVWRRRLLLLICHVMGKGCLVVLSF